MHSQVNYLRYEVLSIATPPPTPALLLDAKNEIRELMSYMQSQILLFLLLVSSFIITYA